MTNESSYYTPEDKHADIAADQAALEGKWGAFAHNGADVGSIQTEAVISIQTRKEDDKRIALDWLRDTHPYMLIEEMVDDGLLDNEELMAKIATPRPPKR